MRQTVLWGLVLLLTLPCAANAQMAWQRHDFKNYGYSLEFPENILQSEALTYNPRIPGCFKRGNQVTWNGADPPTFKRQHADLPTLMAIAVPDEHPFWRGHEAEAAAERARMRRGIVVGLRWEHDDTKAFELRNEMENWVLVFTTWNLFILDVVHPNPDARTLVKERFFNSLRLLPCLSS